MVKNITYNNIERYILSLLFLILINLSIPKNIYATNSSMAASAVLENSIPTKQLISKNYRAAILKKFLESYNSPLADYSQTFINEAKANNIDWRMLPAIAGVESTFGQQVTTNSHNAWGWGIYGNNIIYFNSYNEAIKTISKSLRQNYMDKWGATNIYQIGRLYAASPTWAYHVAYFMNKISEFEAANPIDSLSISL
ncbi:MAG: hypothetical protein M1277_01570 [Patescibacteria group bacterium]|nr:hypothetical protein [Patescibacteria group bacterium]